MKTSRIVWSVIIVAALGLSAFVAVKRGTQLKDCILAQYDLRRDTNFRWLTGRCTATGKDGGQVYVDQLRAFGSDAHHDVDVDHGAN